MAKADYFENELLKYVTGQANDLGTAITPYIALYTTLPGENGGGGTEAAYSGYARQDSTGKWGAPSAGTVSSNATITFPVVTGGGTFAGVCIVDASSSGNIHYILPFRGEALPATASASTDVVTFPAAHGLANGKKIVVEKIDASLSLPAGLSENTTYYVRDTTSTTLKLAATSGGAAIDITSDAALYVRINSVRTLEDGDELRIPSGDFSITEN